MLPVLSAPDGFFTLYSVSPACDLGRLPQAFLSPLYSVHEEMAFRLRTIEWSDAARSLALASSVSSL